MTIGNVEGNEEVYRVWMNPRHRKRILTAKWEIIVTEDEREVIVRPRTDKAGSTHNQILRALIEALRPHILAYNADAVEIDGLAKLKTSLRVGKHRIDLITWDGATYEYWEVKAPYEVGLARTQDQLLDYARNLKSFNLVTTPDGIKNALAIRKLLGLEDSMRVWEVRPSFGDLNNPSKLRKIEG